MNSTKNYTNTASKTFNEVRRCTCCNRKVKDDRAISLCITTEGGEIWHEWPLLLCDKCYYKWYKGRLSTRTLVKREKFLRELSVVTKKYKDPLFKAAAAARFLTNAVKEPKFRLM